MLIIDKQSDLQTLKHLGASPQMLRRIFLFAGWLISTLGALMGLVVGLVVCLLQEHFGFLKLGSGTEYVVSSYPVTVQSLDILIVTIVVLTLGFIASWVPAKKINI